MFEEHGRKGTFPSVTCGSSGAVGLSLLSRRLGPCIPSPSSNDGRRKRQSGSGVARKRRRARCLALGVVLSGALAAPVCSASRGLSRSARARVPPLRGGGRASVKRSAKLACTRSECESPPVAICRNRSVRGCVRVSTVSLQKSSGRRSGSENPATFLSVFKSAKSEAAGGREPSQA